MAGTEFLYNDTLTKKLYSTKLAVETEREQYFRRFSGTDDMSMVTENMDLTKSKGDAVTVGMVMKLGGDGAEGDNKIEGTSVEEGQTYYGQQVLIDVRKKGFWSVGQMSEQRTVYNVRKNGKDGLKVWQAEDLDQQMFMYASGLRGINLTKAAGGEWHFPLSWTGRANNSLAAPDSDHIIYGGNATGAADIDSLDGFDLSIIERLGAKTKTIVPQMKPLRYKGQNKHIVLMHTFQAYDLRTSISQNDWLEIHKATDRGANNPIYDGSLGEYNGFVLHEHPWVIQWDSTIGSYTVDGARALCLGAQSLIIGWGSMGQWGRYNWYEELRDAGNEFHITMYSMYGIKKSTYNSTDYGIIAVDTYVNDPNA